MVIRKRCILFLTMVLSCAILSSGCHTMKRKFTRTKKKAVQEDFIPVLEPVDYSLNNENVLDRYHHHFNLFKVWHDELTDSLKEGANEKRLTYQYTEALKQLEMMKSTLRQEAASGLNQLTEKYSAVGAEFNKPSIMRNPTQLLRQFESYAKKIRIRYNPTDAEGLLKTYE